MLIDLHTHTTRYSSCAKSSPEEMVAEAICVGLDGLAITEHDTMWGDAEFAALQVAFPHIALFRGVEITDAEGNDFVLYGLTRPEHFRRGMPAIELIREARAQGGAIILAHPFRFKPEVPAAIWDEPIDGIEVASTNILGYWTRDLMALRARLGVNAIAASDAHHVSRLGTFATCFPAPVRDDAGLATALHVGSLALCVDIPRIEAYDPRYVPELAALGTALVEG